jgi:hypothetical protein
MYSVDELIGFMEKFTFKSNNSELGEQEDAAAAPSGGEGGYPTVTKWETGLTRGLANTIDDKVTWRSLYTTARGKGNTLI